MIGAARREPSHSDFAPYTWRRLRVLVTGGAGFIGSHLVVALLRRGDDVRVLDNFSTGFRSNLAAVDGEFELLEGDLRSYERVHAAVRGCDAVLHQGALPSVPRSVQDPLTSSEINIGGTLNVLLTARRRERPARRRRLVVVRLRRHAGPARVETMAASPLAPYAVAKLAAEQYALSFNRVYGLETVALRYFNVFGPRQDPRVAVQRRDPEVHRARCSRARRRRSTATASSRATSRSSTTSCRPTCWRSTPRAARARVQRRVRPAALAQRPRRRPQPDARHATSSAIARRAARRRRASTPSPTSRLARRLLGYEPSVDFEVGARAHREARTTPRAR